MTVFDSLPFGDDAAETQIAPELCADAAQRFYDTEPPIADFDSSSVVP